MSYAFEGNTIATMNKQNKRLFLEIFLLVLIAVVVFLLIPKIVPIIKPVIKPIVKPIVKPSSKLTVYTNDAYGFSLSYPKTITSETNFQKYYFLSDSWMAGALEDSKGIPLLCIPVYRVTKENSYPRYWNAEVRIGITTDPKELQTFLTKSIYSDVSPRQEVINGITFYVFPIQDAAMMQYMSGFSYRTIHNGIGYAIEQIKTGSNYRDDHSPKDTPDSVLDEYFNQTTAIIKSFQFIDKK